MKGYTSKLLLGSAIIAIAFAACAPKKKVVATEPDTPRVVQAPKIEQPSGNLVPFTRDLYFKLNNSGLDVKRLKVYVDKAIVLNKVATNDNLEIGPDGTLVKKIGLAENTITILPTTAGAIESVEADGVRVNFGRPGSTLKFFNNTASPVNFTFAPDKINKTNNSNEVTYNGTTYKAGSEGMGSGYPDAKLMIKQLDIEIGNGKGSVEPGVGGKVGL